MTFMWHRPRHSRVLQLVLGVDPRDEGMCQGSDKHGTLRALIEELGPKPWEGMNNYIYWVVVPEVRTS